MDDLPAPAGEPVELLKELPEHQARGSTREIYGEIRRLSGVPMVALVYRHLATIPGALEWAWTLLRPVMTDGLVQGPASRLPARAAVPVDVRLGPEALRQAGISLEDEIEIARVLDAYNRANPINILAVSCLALHLRGSVPAMAELSAGAQGLPAWEPSPAPPALPAMLDPLAMDPEVRDLVWLLADRRAPAPKGGSMGAPPGLDAGKAASRLLPSLYRHLARWPAMLRLTAEIVTPRFPAIDAAADRMREEVLRSAPVLAGRMVPPSDLEPPSGEDRRRLQAALDRFTRRIPEMVVIGHLLRQALPRDSLAGGGGRSRGGQRGHAAGAVSGDAPNDARDGAVDDAPDGGTDGAWEGNLGAIGNATAGRSGSATGMHGAGPLSAEEALRTRRSVRAFLPQPVPRETVEELLALASRSASGSNIQPWKVHVVAGEKRETLTRTILESIERDGYEKYRREWNYYPVNWREPYLQRRRKIGWGLYGLLGIGKGDFEGTERQRRRNYEFFGAPVGMIFTLDDDLEIGSWLDLGIYIGSLTIAARGRGLDTCPQAAFADFHSLIRPLLGIPEKEIIICGLALGHADPEAVENRLVTERASLDDFVTFNGF